MLKSWAIALLVCVTSVVASNVIPNVGIYEDESGVYVDVAVEVKVENGKLVGLTQIFDPEEDPQAPCNFTCDGLTCVDQDDDTHVVTIVSQEKFHDDWDGDANYYVYRGDLSKPIVPGTERRGKTKK